MRIAFVINDLETEEVGYTTTRLAFAALTLGHEVWYVEVGDFSYDLEGDIAVRGIAPPKKKYTTRELMLEDLQGEKAVRTRVSTGDLDVILLRNDPAVDAAERPWAPLAGVMFGRRAMHRGAIVLNNPDGLSRALNKMYFQEFPEEVRPRTLITRDRDEIKKFAKSEGGTIVLKPLQGSGGQSVFLVTPEEVSNLNQMIDAVSRDGYVIAQEYLPAAARGDMRLFMMNGKPLKLNSKYAAFARRRGGGDMRSNIHAGGKVAKVQPTEAALRIAELIRPKLVMDGMFLVGLDIVGDKLMEVNVFSPGGLGSVMQTGKVDFSVHVIEAIERKVQYAAHYRRSTDHAIIAML
jgi:glutathione synthase